ncbi:MAG: amino acid permease [Chitinophagaceae bacterium]|nr:amino acid permease [Chitinophagaceae bacterium]
MSSPQLQRKLGALACVSIVVGAVIGSSIFMKPATMAGQLGSSQWLIIVWVGAGIISLFGGMINAEVGSVLPETGGQYIYFRHMYGDFFAFLAGWAGFMVVNTAAVAAIAFVFAEYAQYFFVLPRFDEVVEKSWVIPIPYVGKIYPLAQIGVKGLAMAVVLAVTWINYYSVRISGSFQVFFTALKVLVLLLLICLIFFSGKGDIGNFTMASSSIHLSGWALVGGLVAATSGALAAYDGWNNLGMVAGEIKNPQRNITRGLLIGIGICILMYILTNLAYLYMMNVDEMRGSVLVASDALYKVLGAAGGGLIALLVMVSTLGAVNGNVLPCARITFAMGLERHFFSWAGKVHPRFHTPANALWLHALWSCLFVFTGSFDMLTDMFVFITWIFYGFAGFGIFILRKKMPNAPRPYRVWGYPIVPAIFVAFTLFYFVLTIYNDILNYLDGKTPVINSVLGLLLTALGIPLYWYLKRKPKPAASSEQM